MNETLTDLSTYFKENAMEINTEKSLYRNITLSNKQLTFSLQVNHKLLYKHMLQSAWECMSTENWHEKLVEKTYEKKVRKK
jgi:hypothetical protein